MEKITLEVTNNEESTGFYRIEILEHGNRCDFVYHGKQLHEINLSGDENYAYATELSPDRLPLFADEIFESWAGDEAPEIEDKPEFIKYLDESLACDKKVITEIVEKIDWRVVEEDEPARIG
jgi:hypothetical protein